jgi:hypothetical protein
MALQRTRSASLHLSPPETRTLPSVYCDAVYSNATEYSLTRSFIVPEDVMDR